MSPRPEGMQPGSGAVRTCVAALAALAALFAPGDRDAGCARAADPPRVRLFVLTGQSNMGPVDAEQVVAPALRRAFPGDRIVVVKHAVGGQAIVQWYRDWQVPEGSKPPPGLPERFGAIYEELTKKVSAAVGDVRPDTVVLVWMQGETDGRNDVLSLAYEASLRGTIAQFRGDLKRPDVRVVVGRINDAQNGRPSWDRVRAAQVKVVETDPLARWFDTDDLNGEKNDVHNDIASRPVVVERLVAAAIASLSAPPKAASPPASP